MDKIREALEDDYKALVAATYVLREKTPALEWRKCPELSQIIDAGDNNRVAMALLSSPVASDAWELEERLLALLEMGDDDGKRWACFKPEAAAEIERFTVERERKAREEEREAFAERAIAWLKQGRNARD